MVWGVIAALLANLFFSAGFVIEKRALGKLPPLSAARPAQVLLALLRSPLWIVGAASLGIGFAAQLIVYRTLPLIAAQGLFVTGLVMLLLMSPVFLGEKPSGRERQSMVAILGALLMIVFSLHQSTESISRIAPAPILLALCLPSLAVGILMFLTASRRDRRRHRLPSSGVPYGVSVGFLYGVSSLAIKGVAGLLHLDDLGGTLSSLLSSPYPYLLLCTGSSGLVLSQTALQRCRASLLVPVCTTVTFLFTVITGTVAFSEPLPHEPFRLALRLGGAAMAVTVLLALPRHEPDPEDPEGLATAEEGTEATATPAGPTTGGATTGTSDDRTAAPPVRPRKPDAPLGRTVSATVHPTRQHTPEGRHHDR
ncbi:DMT family transporter [Streptomyces sp. NPDC005438]|uniref:DMT family transporter n=1 Tax=Streptomyces sp. NPDC005438 TaxID=3156880 RepID=UPI0033A7551B